MPTFEELGYKGFDGVQWYGIVGPANLPAPIVKRLNDEINKLLATPELRERLSGEALEPMPMTPERVRPVHARRHRAGRSVAKERNIELDRLTMAHNTQVSADAHAPPVTTDRWPTSSRRIRRAAGATASSTRRTARC